MNPHFILVVLQKRLTLWDVSHIKPLAAECTADTTLQRR
jgi:hypothetical protein